MGIILNYVFLVRVYLQTLPTLEAIYQSSSALLHLGLESSPTVSPI